MHKSRIENSLFSSLILILFLFSCKPSSEYTVDKTKYTVSYESEISCEVPSVIEVRRGTVLSKEQLPEITSDSHSFLGWYAGDIKAVAGSFIITKNTILTAKWTSKNQSQSGNGGGTQGQPPSSKNDSVTYKVKHFKQHIEDNEYSLLPAMTEEKTAKIGEITNAVAKTFEGFTVKPFEQKKIESEYTVVELYYDRNGCEYTFDLDGGSIEGFASNKMQLKYGEQISVGVPQKDGMIFTGWQPAVPFFAGETNQTFKANYEALKTTANYCVNHYKQNIEDDDYTFESSDTLYFSGNVGSLTTAAANKYKGFTVKPFEQQIIKDDDSTCINIYYDRNTYSIEVSVNNWRPQDYEGSHFRLVNADTMDLATVPDNIISGRYGAPITTNYYAFIGYETWYMGTLTSPSITIIPGEITSICVLPLPEKFTDNVQIELNSGRFSDRIGRGIKFNFKMYNTVTGEVTEDINGLSIDDFMYYHDLTSNTKVKTEADNVKKFSDPISATTDVAQVRLPYIGLLYYPSGPSGRTGAMIYDNEFNYSTQSSVASQRLNPYNCLTTMTNAYKDYPKIDSIKCWYLEPDCSGDIITNFNFATYKNGYTEENEITLYMKVTPCIHKK